MEPPPEMRGRSLRPALEGGNAAWRDFCVSEVNTNSGRMVRTQRYKYITYAGDETEQLFDMVQDPGELTNLADDAGYADVLAAHRRLLGEWESRLDVAPDVPNQVAWRG